MQTRSTSGPAGRRPRKTVDPAISLALPHTRCPRCRVWARRDPCPQCGASKQDAPVETAGHRRN